MAVKTWKAWGGFADGKLDVWEIDDGWGGFGGSGSRRSPAIFTSRKVARQRFMDVRPIIISPAPKKKQRKNP